MTLTEKIVTEYGTWNPIRPNVIMSTTWLRPAIPPITTLSGAVAMKEQNPRP